MAEPESGSVTEEAHPETHGNRLTRAFKRVKPGEWILIGIGVVGLVVYFVWYRGQQASNTANALTPAGGTSNPWSSSAVDPSQLDSDIQALTTALQNGVATTPGTSLGGTTGASSGGSAIADADHAARGVAGSSSADVIPVPSSSSSPVAAPASSGSGISQASNNQAPVANLTQVVHASAPAPTVHSVNNTSGWTGNVGVPVRSSPASSPVFVPPNVTTGGQLPNRAAQTVGSQPVRRPAGVRPA